MKNTYFLAALDTVKFVVYVGVLILGLHLLGDAVGEQTAREIFYGGFIVVMLGILYMINLARRKYKEDTK